MRGSEWAGTAKGTCSLLVGRALGHSSQQVFAESLQSPCLESSSSRAFGRALFPWSLNRMSRKTQSFAMVKTSTKNC